MKIISNPQELRRHISAWKQENVKIGFVPTMGYLHQGHLSLMREAKTKSDRLVASIFVNPRQFGPSEDLDAYPRNPERDSELAEEVGVDILFLPPVEAIYPEGYQTNVSVSVLSRGMCGESRPGHFDGVATIITKLFNLVTPDVAVFGEKDFQQLAVIRRLTKDLNFDIEIIGHPIVREQDGLALSSRNRYLSESERKEALSLSRSLREAKEKVQRQGSCAASEIINDVRSILEQADGCRVDYISLVDSLSLIPVEKADKGNLLAIAVFFNDRVRLIDNILL